MMVFLFWCVVVALFLGGVLLATRFCLPLMFAAWEATGRAGDRLAGKLSAPGVKPRSGQVCSLCGQQMRW